MHPAEIFGPVTGEHALEEIRDAPRRRCVLTATGGEGARDQGEERAIDQRVAVDEKQTGRWWLQHLRILAGRLISDNDRVHLRAAVSSSPVAGIHP
jgi:hypothetical protein